MSTQETPAVNTATPTWPRDVHGITSGLRRELVRTIGRIKGNDDKLEVFIGHLREAAKFAQGRIEVQKKITEQRAATVAARVVKEQTLLETAEKKLTNGNVKETASERAMRQANAGIMGSTTSKV